MSGWQGGATLFRPGPNGLTICEVRPDLEITESDATALSATLRNFVANHPEPNNDAVNCARQIAEIAAEGRFIIQFSA
jgi:hypothetical protein